LDLKGLLFSKKQNAGALKQNTQKAASTEETSSKKHGHNAGKTAKSQGKKN
jgi:hypothetical protein